MPRKPITIGAGPLDAGHVAAAIGFAAVATMIGLVMAPWFKDTTTFGFHDWDAQTSHRYLTLISLLRYHQFPGWDPYACGGFPAWGYVEADTILVSPFLPAYLILPMALALRVEVLGMAVLGAAGAYLAAARFTAPAAGRAWGAPRPYASYAAPALVAVMWAVNGRWALQTAAGHTWHLAYAWTPWCLYFFERARRPERTVKDLAGGGACIAMLVYSGGIYPLPHTVLLLGVYAAVLAALDRSPRPIVTLGLLGAIGVALAAPKLLPLLDGFGKVPRLIDSTETLDLGAFWTLLTSRDQGFGSRPARVTPYGWHEWGMYISAAGAILLAGAVVLVQGRREAALKAAGLVFLLLGFGAFHPEAPWTLLHKYAPIFRSQHVPSRFHYTAVLVLGIVAAAGVARVVARRKRWAAAWDLVASLLVLGLALDVGVVAQKPMAAAMWMVPPDHIPQDRAFHFEQEPPFQYKRRDWAGPMYLAMLGNTGVINCYGTPPFDRKGARPTTAPDYHGEAYVVRDDGRAAGKATVAAWSPNHAVIRVEGAEPGALAVYNMNFDEGWHSDAGPVVPFHDALAVRLPQGGDARVTLSYRPPGLVTGLLCAAITVAALVWLRRREVAA
jgi:hypothetical protein